MRRLVLFPLVMLLVLTSAARARLSRKEGPSAGAKPVEAATLPGETAFNSCVKLPPDRRVKVTLKPGTELKDLVAWISSMTCKGFIVAQGVRSQPVTLTSPGPISAREAYRAFISALGVMGLTVVPSGRFLKVVPAAWALHSPTRVLGHDEQGRLPATEEVVTQLLRLRHARIDQLLAALQKMKSRSGDVSAYLPGRTLIITDEAGNVRRMAQIVRQLDIPARRGQIWVVRPRYADPAELAQLLGELFASDKAGGSKAGADEPPTRFVTDAASGALLVLASEAVFRRVHAVVKAVDLESSGVQARAWVYRLRHGDAQQMAGELASLGASAGSAAAPATRRGQQGARRQPSGAAGGQAPLFEGQVQITAIKATNSLLVVAATRDYLKLRKVIAEIDRPRRQVFIEAYVLEVKLDKQRDVGLALHGGKLFGSSAVFGGLAHGSGLTSLALAPTDLMGLAVGVQGKLLDGNALGLGYDIPAFGIALRAMQQDHDIDVLSSPHLLTTDNEEAEILVGVNIPQRAGGGPSLPSTGGAQQQQLTLMANLVPTVEHVDVGLRLKLTPTIGEGDAIRLVLEQKVDKVDKIDFAGLGASKSRREIRTTVTVQDRQTVVIGGLIDRRIETGQSKIPLLGDIPLIGRLFRRETKHTVRTNMIVVLTPHIIRDRTDLQRIFVEKLAQREDFIRRYTAHKQRLGLTPVDYRHKRGLLAEINHYGARVEAERRLAREAGAPDPMLKVQRIE